LTSLRSLSKRIDMNTGPTQSGHPRDETLPLRLFVAILLPDDVRAALDRVQVRLRNAMDSVAWVCAGNMHLSLAFLGEQPPARAYGITAVLDRAASSVSPFSLRVRGTGFFGRPDAPRVIWAGVEAADDLAVLHSNLTVGLRSLGIPVETRPFHPHITLGRIKRWRPGSRGSDVFPKEETFGGTVTVTSIHLMKSTLDPGGAIYESLHESRLGLHRAEDSHAQA